MAITHSPSYHRSSRCLVPLKARCRKATTGKTTGTSPTHKVLRLLHHSFPWRAVVRCQAPEVEAQAHLLGHRLCLQWHLLSLFATCSQVAQLQLPRDRLWHLRWDQLKEGCPGKPLLQHLRPWVLRQALRQQDHQLVLTPRELPQLGVPVLVRLSSSLLLKVMQQVAQSTGLRRLWSPLELVEEKLHLLCRLPVGEGFHQRRTGVLQQAHCRVEELQMQAACSSPLQVFLAWHQHRQRKRYALRVDCRRRLYLRVKDSKHHQQRDLFARRVACPHLPWTSMELQRLQPWEALCLPLEVAIQCKVAIPCSLLV